jgi:tRNA uridine 5-carboxymethylaminomethyl modification enzyme
MEFKYDIIVVGGGHAGCEAAAAAANMGSKTLLITIDMTKFAQMSCNPAIGGIAKGQIVREIDALGGYTGIVTDLTTIQFRMLNKSKGPAMWSPRAQCDRAKFSLTWRHFLENIPNLDLWQGNVVSLIIENDSVNGVITDQGVKIFSKAVILTNGTFLGGLIHIGRNKIIGGRIGEPSSVGLTEQLINLGFESGRLKTGTPARLDGRSIDFNQLQKQNGDDNPGKFSFLSKYKTELIQKPCYIVYTNLEVHEILKTGFNDSPLFKGIIKGRGPRYCPSIEDKIVTFHEKPYHQLFLEPEGDNTNEYYLNGFSSSLPWNIQLRALRKIKGLENAKIYRPGYAIEYDYFPPTQLYHNLETKIIKNLFFAGQINGTTGYEEAAAQGIIAGINAHLKIYNNSQFILNRDQAYIGVLIDDLVTKGVDEPYRMFTSRAEFRILLRQDNADSRLTPLGYQLGLVNEERYSIFKQKESSISNIINFIKSHSIKPEIINEYLNSINSSPLKQKTKIYDLILRPEISFKELYLKFPNIFTKLQINNLSNEIFENIDILVKYSGYIERESLLAEKINRLEHITLPNNIDYLSLKSISTEGRQKLNKIKPSTLGQASRIPGVSPADINALLLFIGR